MNNFVKISDSDSDKKIMRITIGDRTCVVKPINLFMDMVYVLESMKDDPTLESKKLISHIISYHTYGVFTEAEIYTVEESVFTEYVDLCLNNEPVLNNIFNSVTADNSYDRFILSVDRMARDYSKNIQEGLKRTSEVIGELTKSISMIAESVVNQWAKSIKPTIDSIKSWVFNSNYLESISKNIQLLIQSIKTPSISEQRKNELIHSYKEWGKMGWTIPPNAPFALFDSVPQDSKEAYNLIRPYVRASDMNALFDELKKLKNIRISDLEIAISCYNSKLYKPCAMVLFSMIDSRLIRFQTDEDRNSKGKRPTGGTAAVNFLKRMKKERIKERMLITLLFHYNIFCSVTTLFSDGDDFKLQPHTINRNFLEHGMLHRNVGKMDCIMVFLLLYNFTEHVNSLI